MPHTASSLFVTTSAAAGASVWAPPPALRGAVPRPTKLATGLLLAMGSLLILVAALLVLAGVLISLDRNSLDGNAPNLAVASCIAALAATFGATWLVWRYGRVERLLSWGHCAQATIIAVEQRRRWGTSVVDLSYRFIDDRGLTQAGVASGVRPADAAALGLDEPGGAPFSATVVFDRRDSGRNFLYRPFFVTLRDETGL